MVSRLEQVDAALDWALGVDGGRGVERRRATDHGIEESIPELARLSGFAGHNVSGESLLKHSLRVSRLLGEWGRYQDLFGRRLDLGAEEAESLEWAGLLHDLSRGVRPSTMSEGDRLRWDAAALAAVRVPPILRRVGLGPSAIGGARLLVEEQRRILNLACIPVGLPGLDRVVYRLGRHLDALILFSVVHAFEEHAEVDAVVAVCNRLLERQSLLLSRSWPQLSLRG